MDAAIRMGKTQLERIVGRGGEGEEGRKGEDMPSVQAGTETGQEERDVARGEVGGKGQEEAQGETTLRGCRR